MECRVWWLGGRVVVVEKSVSSRKRQPVPERDAIEKSVQRKERVRRDNEWVECTRK
jgi:hypothetical protein